MTGCLCSAGCISMPNDAFSLLSLWSQSSDDRLCMSWVSYLHYTTAGTILYRDAMLKQIQTNGTVPRECLLVWCGLVGNYSSLEPWNQSNHVRLPTTNITRRRQSPSTQTPSPSSPGSFNFQPSAPTMFGLLPRRQPLTTPEFFFPHTLSPLSIFLSSTWPSNGSQSFWDPLIFH